MLPFSMKSRSLPSDLPLNDVAPLQEYTGTSGGYWKIYRSKLISSQVDVSVFLFDKTVCNKLKQKKTLLNAVWKHVDMIQNIQKYSSVTLKIVLTAKENRRYIAYATEPVVGSLANILGDYPNDISQAHASLLNKTSLCEMEIKYGVVAIAEALSYLHLYEAMIHCDVSPRNIVVCTNGAWRLSGFHFMMKAEAPHQLVLNHERPDSITTDFLQPDINFAAPCLFLGTPTQESDIFSLGMLITYVYNNGISLLEGTAVVREIYRADVEMMGELFDERISSAYNAIKAKIPVNLQHGLSKMISFDIDTRPTAQQFMMLGYFHDPLIKYLKRLNLFENLTEADRGIVLSNELPECAKHLPQTMLMTHVIPILTQELELSHLYPGVLHSTMICLSRLLTTANTEVVCKLVNQILDIDTAAQLSPQAHETVMSHISLLYDKSSQITNLYSPMPVVMLGLADKAKMAATLDAITELVKYHTEVTVLTDQLIEEVKKCFVLQWRQGNQEICGKVLNSVLVWLSILGEQSLSQNFACWFVELIRRHLDILYDIKGVIMTMLSDRDKYTLTDAFIEKDLSLAVENLIAISDLTNVQRYTLVQLVRDMEKSSQPVISKTGQVTSKIISTGGVPATNTITRNLSSKSVKPNLHRQSNTTVAPQETRSSSIPLQQAPKVVITKSADPSCARRAKSEASRMHHGYRASSEDAAEQRRKLFKLDWSLTRSKHTSFGELMADIDDRATILTGGSRSPLLLRGNRTSSLQTPSTQSPTPDDVLERRPSLQAEHYHSLSAPSLGKPPSNQDGAIDRSVVYAGDMSSVVDKLSQVLLQYMGLTYTYRPTAQTESNASASIDTQVMKSILQQLDNLTAQFTSNKVVTLTNDGLAQ